MNRFAFLAAPAIVFLATTGNVDATVLYQPTPIGSSARASDYGATDQGGFRAFDNFTVSMDAAVTTVSWRGFWMDSGNPQPAPAPSPDVLTWDVAFHADNGGIPGSQLYFMSFSAGAVTSQFVGTGGFSAGGIFNVSYYDYSVDLPSSFAVSAGAQYWVSIMAHSDLFDPLFALRGATGGDNSSYQQQLGPGQSVISGNAVAADRAITLEGTINETPLPGTFIPVATVLAGGALLLRRLRKAS